MKIISFESLEFLLSSERNKYHVFHIPNGPCHDLTVKNYDLEKIISITLSEKDKKSQKRTFDLFAYDKGLVKTTNFTDLVKKHDIKALMPDTYSTKFLEKWAKEEGVQLIVTPHRLQKKIENKIFFDKFLQKYKLPAPKSWALRSEKDLEKIDVFPVMIQIPKSNGSAGTFLVKNKQKILNLIHIEKKVKFPLLCRQFIDQGLSLGISAFIGKKNMIFSALRAQVYFSQPNGKSTYYGIQWIKTKMFPDNIIKKINTMIQTAGEKLQGMGFRGIASFDLIVKGENVYFIECNPRTGASSPQISANPELLHGYSLSEEFVRTTSGQELSTHKPFIPNSEYEGSTLDFGFLADIYPQGKKVKNIKSGIYKFENKKLEYVSSRVEDLKKENNVLIYYVSSQGSKLSQMSFIGFLIANFPLLKIKGTAYTLDEKINPLLQHIEELIIQK